MSYKQIIFTPFEYYHVYNRSVASEALFSKKADRDRFLDLLDYYRFKQLIRFSKFKSLSHTDKQKYVDLILGQKKPCVEIFCYSLMDNHYHLIIRELFKEGIRNFVSNLQNGYAKYFNTKYERHGSLFTNPFKATWINSEEQLKHATRYCHLNHVTSYQKTLKEAMTSLESSFPFYVSDDHKPVRIMKGTIRTSLFLNTDYIISLFGSRDKYIAFISNQVDYQRTLHKIKKLLPKELRKIRKVQS